MSDYEHDSIELHREANDAYFGAPWKEEDFVMCDGCGHDWAMHIHSRDSKHDDAWVGPCCHGGCSCPEYVPETEEAA
jgi:hypothetical protein